MAELTRVPTPRSPFNGRWGTVVGLVLAGFAMAIVKPWGSSTPAFDRQVPFTTPGPPVAVVPVPTGRPYDAAAFGPTAPAPAWELWAADRVTRVRFVGPPDGFATPSPAPPAPGAPPTPPPLVAGPVIELGTTDALGAFAVNAPEDAHLAAVRLWRFTVGGEPRRVELRELDAPWRADHFRVFGPRRGGLPRGDLAAWEPGLYRLDLLIDPVDRIRSLLLVVRPGASATAPGGDAAPRATEPLDVELLRRLPDAAVVWAFGSVLSGWSRDDAAGGCRVADIWRASGVDEPCHPIPLGRPVAVGVNLPGGQAVASIRLSELDPLPGPVETTRRTTVDGRTGVAMVEVPSPGLHDGLYRLEVTTAVGRSLRWFVEVGPDPYG
jgi:hypothetical protein